MFVVTDQHVAGKICFKQSPRGHNFQYMTFQGRATFLNVEVRAGSRLWGKKTF